MVVNEKHGSKLDKSKARKEDDSDTDEEEATRASKLRRQLKQKAVLSRNKASMGIRKVKATGASKARIEGHLERFSGDAYKGKG